LKANGSTSHARTQLVELHRDGDLYQDTFGRLRVDGNSERACKVAIITDADNKTLKVTTLPTNGKPTNGKPTNGKPTNGKPFTVDKPK